MSHRALIENAIDLIIETNSELMASYLGGNEKLFGYFISKTMCTLVCNKELWEIDLSELNLIMKQKLDDKKQSYHDQLVNGN